MFRGSPLYLQRTVRHLTIRPFEALVCGIPFHLRALVDTENPSRWNGLRMAQATRRDAGLSARRAERDPARQQSSERGQPETICRQHLRSSSK